MRTYVVERYDIVRGWTYYKASTKYSEARKFEEEHLKRFPKIRVRITERERG